MALCIRLRLGVDPEVLREVLGLLARGRQVRGGFIYFETGRRMRRGACPVHEGALQSVERVRGMAASGALGAG